MTRKTGRAAVSAVAATLLPIVEKLRSEFPNLKGYADEKQADNGLLNVVQISEQAKNKWQEFARSLVMLFPTMPSVEAYVSREETARVIARGLAKELQNALLVPADAVPDDMKETRKAAQQVVSTYKARITQYARDIIEGKQPGEREDLTLSDVGESLQKLAKKHGDIEGASTFATMTMTETAQFLIKGGDLIARLRNIVAMAEAIKK